MAPRRGMSPRAAVSEKCSEFTVIAFFQGIVEIGGCVDFAVILDLLVTLELDGRAVVESNAVGGVLEIALHDQYALESLGIEAKRGAALQALFVGIKINIFELFVGVIGRDVGGLGNGRVHPALRGGLDFDVFLRINFIGGDEIIGQFSASLSESGSALVVTSSR